MRATVQMIEPELYATYRLVLENNISPQRATNLWADNAKSYYAHNGHEKIKHLLDHYIVEFWGKSGMKVMSESKDIIKFIKEHQPKWWKFW